MFIFRGKICTFTIPSGTFSVLDLKYSVYPIDHGNDFLEAENDEIKGIGFNTGDYQFRLEARDSNDQVIFLLNGLSLD